MGKVGEGMGGDERGGEGREGKTKTMLCPCSSTLPCLFYLQEPKQDDPFSSVDLNISLALTLGQ